MWHFTFSIIFFLVAAFHSSTSQNLTCYDCFTGNVSASILNDDNHYYAKCQGTPENGWDTWQCPEGAAGCAYMKLYLIPFDMYETARSCNSGGPSGFCNYSPPPGVHVLDCITCQGDKCNLANELDARSWKNPEPKYNDN